MPRYKNIRIPKRGGGSRLQRVQVLKSGKYKFVKNKPRKRRKTKSRKRRPRRRSRRSRSRKVSKVGRKRKLTIPLAPMAGLFAGIAPAAKAAMEGRWVGSGGVDDWLISNYTGIKVYEGGRFDASWLMRGLIPLILGGLVHKYVGGAPLNLNRVLGQAGVPLIRI